MKQRWERRQEQGRHQRKDGDRDGNGDMDGDGDRLQMKSFRDPACAGRARQG